MSPETCRIVGFDLDDRVHDAEQWKRRVDELLHPDDRERAEATRAAALAGAACDLEFRFVLPDASVRTLHACFELEREGQTPVRLFGTLQDVTGLRSIEERLAASKELFRAVVDHASDALFLHDGGGTILDVNRQACESLGYTRAELLGMSPPQFDPDITEEDRARLRRRLDGGEVASFDTRHKRKDGTTFPVEVRGRGFECGGRRLSVTLARDITTRKLAELQLRASEERFREVAETIDDVFWVADVNTTRILYVSPAYETIWGRSCKSLYEAPRSWSEAVHPDDRDRVLAAVASKQTQGAYDEEYRIIRPDGQVRWIHDSAFLARDANGEVARYVGVARDVTQSRLLQEQLLQSQKMEAIGQLAGGVAHDFNNFLAAIIGECDLAATVPDASPAAREGFANIRDAAEHARDLARQLLLFARRQPLQLRELDLNGVVSELAKLLRRVIGESVKLSMKLHPQPLRVAADSGMIDHLVMNLAINARDAMPDGGRLMIETGMRSVDGSGGQTGPHAFLRVSDNGVGIEPSALPRIFEPFYTTKDRAHGIGLGLATAFGVAKQHGGWIDVESTPGAGSTFTVFLPIAPASSAPSESSRFVAAAQTTILLVEDNPQVRRVVRRLLAARGFQVLDAGDPEEALRIWNERRASISLLLTDMVMEGMSGPDLAKRIRQDAPDLPVVFMSGYAHEVTGGVPPGEHFLTKPFDAADLVEMIRFVLARPS